MGDPVSTRASIGAASNVASLISIDPRVVSGRVPDGLMLYIILFTASSTTDCDLPSHDCITRHWWGVQQHIVTGSS